MSRARSKVVRLRRTGPQRAFGWAMAAIWGCCTLGYPVLAVASWTGADGETGPTRWIVLAASPLMVLFGAIASAGLRLGRCPAGTVTLGPDVLVIEDRSVFTRAVELPRSAIAEIAPAPPGRSELRGRDPGDEHGAAIVSLFADRPDVALWFTEPRRIGAARWNLSPHRYADPPRPWRHLDGLLLCTATGDGRRRLQRWWDAP